MIDIQITIALRNVPGRPELARGDHHIGDVMPHILDRYGLTLELEQDPNSERPAPSSKAIDLFDVMIACLEEALAN